MGLLVGCGSDGTSGSATSTPRVALTAANISFDRTQIDVRAGSVTFVVKNNDKVEHNLTIDNGGVDKEVEEERRSTPRRT